MWNKSSISKVVVYVNPSILLDALFSFNSVVVYVICRYGTAELCKDQCLFLAGLLATHGFSPSPQCCHLVVLVRRLLKFLAPSHQVCILVS